MTNNNQSDCGVSLGKHTCNRQKDHDGRHQAPANEEDDYYGLQLVEWWSIKPNGEPAEDGL